MKLLGAWMSYGAVSAALVLAPATAGAQTAQTFELAPPTVVQVNVESRSFLGVGVQEIDGERAKALKLKEEYGVEITRVDEDSPAEHAGLKAGDVVQSYNGQRVEGATQFIRFVRETPPGRAAKLTVIRQGEEQTIAVVVGARSDRAMTFNPPDMRFEVPEFNFPMPDIPRAMMSWRSAMLGVEAEALGDTQLADYFGVKQGVLVRSVQKGTAAEKAGLKAGDVLVKVDQEEVTTPREVTSALRTAHGAGKKVIPLVAMREHKELSFSVTLQDTLPPTPRLRGTPVVTPE
jgi:serine protease Do